MSVAIFTDTNSGISVEEGESLGIGVIPMPVIVGGKDHIEGINITHPELYAAMREKKEVSTSQVSPEAFLSKAEEMLARHDEAVYIPMSSGLSASCDTARGLAKEFAGRVFVADNHRISTTLRESVLDAKSLADQGKSAAEINKYLEDTAYNSSIYITVNSLYYLKKSGRVTPAASIIATALNIKPVLTIQGGKLDAFKKIRGMKKSMTVMTDAIAADIRTRFPAVPMSKIRIGAAGTLETQEEIEEWTNLVQAVFPEVPVYYTALSCSIACHVGIGSAGIGVSVIEEGRAN